MDACEVKIADFGLSALVRLDEDGYDAEESGKRKRYTHLKEMWGTAEYFAPEVINQAYGPQADVWALGCVLYEMLCGEQVKTSHIELLNFFHELVSYIMCTQTTAATGFPHERG